MAEGRSVGERAVRPRGAVDDEETAPGMMCVGAAIRDRAGRGAGAVAVSMVKAAMTDDALSTVAAEMRRLLSDPAEIDGLLRRGAEKAHALSAPVLADVKRVVGFVS